MNFNIMLISLFPKATNQEKKLKKQEEKIKKRKARA